MNYKAYGNRNGKQEILIIGSAKNEKEMCEIILMHKDSQHFCRIEYGKKSYSMQDLLEMAIAEAKIRMQNV